MSMQDMCEDSEVIMEVPARFASASKMAFYAIFVIIYFLVSLIKCSKMKICRLGIHVLCAGR